MRSLQHPAGRVLPGRLFHQRTTAAALPTLQWTIPLPTPLLQPMEGAQEQELRQLERAVAQGPLAGNAELTAHAEAVRLQLRGAELLKPLAEAGLAGEVGSEKDVLQV